MNKWIGMGRLTRDVEVKTTKSGKMVARFCLAVDRGKKNGESLGADFIDVVAWEKSADLLQRYTHKGSMLLVEGHLTAETYEKDGKKIKRYEVVCERFEFAGAKSSTPATDAGFPGEEDEDVPF